MRFASAWIAARIDFLRNTPTSGSQMRNVRTMSSCRHSGRSLEQISNPHKRSLSAGVGALSNNTEGDDSRAIGASALFFNISGDNNAALRRSAGVSAQPQRVRSMADLKWARLHHERPCLVSKSSRVLRHVSGSTKSMVVTYSISAVILPLTFFNVTVSTPASFT